MYLILILFGSYFFISNLKNKKSINLYSWYILGQIFFFVLPYSIIEIFNFEFKYNFSLEVKLKGWLILILSNLIIYIFYKLSYRINFNLKFNSLFLRLLNYILIFLVLFSFLFAINNILSIGIENISNNNILRSKISVLGPFSIILLLPIGYSTYFWIKFINGDKSLKNFISIFLFTFIALIVAFSRGQRTDLILIPLLPIFYYFFKSRNFKILLYGFSGALIICSYYATTLKTNLQNLNLNIVNAAIEILKGDIDRNWTFWMAIDNTGFLTNKFMDNTFEGYIYTLFTFIPRSIAYFKGYSTETWFVFNMGNYYESTWRVLSISDINWGVTLSGITEAIINGGIVGLLLYSIVMGLILKIIESFNQKYVYLNSILPFLVVLFSGYTFYNLLVIYVPIIMVLLILNQLDLKDKNK